MDQSQKAQQQMQSEPDWTFWARLPGWRYREGAALLLGLDPFNNEQNEHNVEYQRLVFLLRRAWNMDQLESPLRPRFFLEWAMDNGIDVSDDLLEIVAGTATITDWKKTALRYRKQLRISKAEIKRSVGEELHPKSRKSLLRIIYVIALKKYNYKPGHNNSAATNIYKEIQKYDPSLVSEQTIRDWLKVAEDEVGDEFEADDGN